MDKDIERHIQKRSTNGVQKGQELKTIASQRKNNKNPTHIGFFYKMQQTLQEMPPEWILATQSHHQMAPATKSKANLLANPDI